MAKWKVIRKAVEHYEHIVEADGAYEAGQAAMQQAIDGDYGEHDRSGDDSYPDLIVQIKEVPFPTGALDCTVCGMIHLDNVECDEDLTKESE